MALRKSTPVPDSRAAVAYVRVSTQDQAREGCSLDAQEERVRAYCTAAGLDLVALVREEGVSGGKSLSVRPGGQEVLSLIESGQAAHVVSLKLDRLFRDAADCLNQTRAWDKTGVALHLVDMGGQAINTGSAMGRMFLTMAAGFAELERNLISERTTAALSYLKGQGVQLGAPALADSPTIERCRALRSEGYSLRQIASTLEAEGRKTLRGGKWGPETVRKVLLREAA